MTDMKTQRIIDIRQYDNTDNAACGCGAEADLFVVEYQDDFGDLTGDYPSLLLCGECTSNAKAEEIVTALRPEATDSTGVDVPDDMWDNTVPGVPYKPCYDISPKSEILRACDHRQCPPDRCQGC